MFGPVSLLYKQNALKSLVTLHESIRPVSGPLLKLLSIASNNAKQINMLTRSHIPNSDGLGQ